MKRKLILKRQALRTLQNFAGVHGAVDGDTETDTGGIEQHAGNTIRHLKNSDRHSPQTNHYVMIA